MHTVETNNVVKTNQAEFKSMDDYTSILNSAVDSTKRAPAKERINRFFYSVGDYNFLFEQELKVENIPMTPINKVPNAPDWCTGIISVRGVIMPVIDMHTILKSELNHKPKVKKKEKNDHLLMIEHKLHVPIILQIDKLPERVDIKNYTYSKVKKDSPNWLTRTWKNSTNKLFEINHNELFTIIKSVNN